MSRAPSLSRRRTSRLVALVGLLLVGLAPAASSREAPRPEPASDAAAPPGRAAVVAYRPPLPDLVVVRAFDPPRTRYGPGHLGVDLRAGPGAAVSAAADGTVTFAGSVAGRGVVVLTHADGIRTEYEPIRASVRAGATVRAGRPIGRITGHHRGCAGWCLHWGARRGENYLDPLGLLGRSRPLGPVRLLPWSG